MAAADMYRRVPPRMEETSCKELGMEVVVCAL